MLRISVLVLAVWLFAAPSWAGTYQVTTDSVQDAALTWIVGKANAERAKQATPLVPLTNQDYLQQVANGFLNGWAADKSKSDTCVSLTAAQKAAMGSACP